MRKALALAALALATPFASAQIGPDIRFVTTAEAEVRSGPSDDPKFYPTNRLHRGDPVEVVGELDGGWLKIKPPQGSFSFINARFLQHIVPNQPNSVVTSADGGEPVYIGSAIVTDHRPTVIGARLQRGAQVIAIGKVETAPDGAWLRIEAPAKETRYIRADVVAKQLPNPGSGLAGGTAAGTPGGPLQPSKAPSANPPLTPEMLLQNAADADRGGQINEAVRLYYLAAAKIEQTNPTLALQARQRANYLQSGYQAAPAAPAVGAPIGAVGPAAGSESENVVRLNPPQKARATWVDGTNVSAPLRRDPPPAAAAAAPATGQLPPGWSSYKGRLRSAGRAIEGQKTYVLEMEVAGCVRPIAYTVGSPGVDLSPWVGRVIQVSGPAVYRGDIRTNYLTAMRIAPE